MLCLQPLLLGLILLSRRMWILGGVLAGSALLIVLVVEIYCTWKTREPSVKSLSPVTRESLQMFARAQRRGLPGTREEDGSILSPGAQSPRSDGIMRGSIASVLDMMSLTLAVMPSASRGRGPLPLPTEAIDDLVSTEKAARTHPDAPPYLPFNDRAEETAGLLYPPELLAPIPMIWLPNDHAGVAHSEAIDLQRYHGLETTIDVVPDQRSTDPHLPAGPRRSSSVRSRPRSRTQRH
jgi:hypothetical protein